MRDKIGWCILGPGKVANRFMRGIAEVPNAGLAAVGSHTQGKGEAFAGRFGAKSYMNYEEAILDKDVDVVYVATPHNFHMEHVLLALKLGKPVLCEKPFAVNAVQARTMVSMAREKKLFLMEAMWSRFFPVMKKVRDWLAELKIGQVHYVTADFASVEPVNPSSRLFSKELAGGSLLDVGVYTISFANMIFGGKPEKITCMHYPASTGVDARVNCMLGYQGGGFASLFSSITTNTSWEARVFGDNGYIIIPNFYAPKKAFLYKNNLLFEEYYNDFKGDGMQFEIEAVQEDLLESRFEDLLMPLDETVVIADIMDTIRKQIGLVYPFELN